MLKNIKHKLLLLLQGMGTPFSDCQAGMAKPLAAKKKTSEL